MLGGEALASPGCGQAEGPEARGPITKSENPSSQATGADVPKCFTAARSWWFGFLTSTAVAS